MKSNKKYIDFLKERLDHIKFFNRYGPFPYYGKDVEQDYENKIKEMQKDYYNDEPVYACKYCKSLHIVVDDLDNNICITCGSKNEFVEYENIDEYLKEKDGK